MKASIGGAIKALVEPHFVVGGNPTLTVFRTRHPQDNPELRRYPYGVVQEGISNVPDVSNPDDDSDEPGIFEQVQFDLYQQWKDPATQDVIEDPALRDQLYKILHGAKLPLAPNRVYGMHVLNCLPLDDEDANLIRWAYTVEIARSLTSRR